MTTLDWSLDAGQYNHKALTQYAIVTEQIKQLRSHYPTLAGDEIANAVERLREDLRNWGDDVEGIAQVRPSAYALVAEMARRLRREYPYDVQFVGALALDDNHIIEMGNGEGKTLLATMPIFFHWLRRNAACHVHVVTDNNHLAQRDALSVGPILLELGMSVAAVSSDGTSRLERTAQGYTLTKCETQAAYCSDVIYVEQTQLIFDYLYDSNEVFAEKQRLPPLDFALIDEADSILIDEARTPLIISRPIERWYGNRQLIRRADEVVRQLSVETDLTIDTAQHFVTLTPRGEKKVHVALNISNIYDDETNNWYRLIRAALEAHHLYHNEQHYIIADNRLVLIDAKTGRPLFGRRYQGILGCALEAKHKLAINPETREVATITVQNFFALYQRLAGMSGTAAPERDEFEKIYKTPVLKIPPRLPTQVTQFVDLIYSTKDAKLRAVVESIFAWHEKGNPVLVGTQTVEEANLIYNTLRHYKVDAALLTAQNHADEAQIIAQAGRAGAITVAARMAGRGTDIQPDETALQLGGLVVLGTERKTERIDGQLRGRTGRRGQPGFVQFFLSLEDELLIRFNGERIRRFNAAIMDDDLPIENRVVDRIVLNSQKRLQRTEFLNRQRYYRYDDILDDQRHHLRQLRSRIWRNEHVDQLTDTLATSFVEQLVKRWLSGGKREWQLRKFVDALVAVGVEREQLHGIGSHSAETVTTLTTNLLLKALQTKRALTAEMQLPYNPEGVVLLDILQNAWIAHLEKHNLVRRRLTVQGVIEEHLLARYARQSQTLYYATLHSAEKDFLIRWHTIATSGTAIARWLAKRLYNEKLYQSATRAYNAMGADKQASDWYSLARSQSHLEQWEPAIEAYIAHIRQLQRGVRPPWGDIRSPWSDIRYALTQWAQTADEATWLALIEQIRSVSAETDHQLPQIAPIVRQSNPRLADVLTALLPQGADR